MSKLPVSTPAPAGTFAVEVFGDGGFAVSGKDNVARYRAVAQKHALKLELRGIRFSRGSVYAQVKKEYGFKGSKQSVLNQLTDYITNNFSVERTNDHG